MLFLFFFFFFSSRRRHTRFDCDWSSDVCSSILRHAKLWPALIRSEAAIRSSLADLFLELVLDRDSGVAFTRQADTEDVDAPVLLRTSPLTFIDSVLLLYLRQQLAEADARGNRAVVADAEMAEA